jgi:deoxyadenosine/deoxycytidine kinase
MLVAQRIRKENIAEYILYLYQVEDLIRVFKLDMDLIRDKIVARYNADNKTRDEILAWYENLAIMMAKEEKRDKGHMQFIINLAADLNEFHLKLMDSEVDHVYPSVFKAVAGLISELKQKNPGEDADVNIALDGIYGYLLLKIQKREITNETEEAIKRLSNWLAYLSQLFRKYEEGDLEL